MLRIEEEPGPLEKVARTNETAVRVVVAKFEQSQVVKYTGLKNAGFDFDEKRFTSRPHW